MSRSVFLSLYLYRAQIFGITPNAAKMPAANDINPAEIPMEDKSIKYPLYHLFYA